MEKKKRKTKKSFKSFICKLLDVAEILLYLYCFIVLLNLLKQNIFGTSETLVLIYATIRFIASYTNKAEKLQTTKKIIYYILKFGGI